MRAGLQADSALISAVRKSRLPHRRRFVVCGIATSAQPADLGRLLFPDINPVGDFGGDQPRMVGKKDDLRIERVAGDNRPLQTSLGPVGSRDAVRVDELVAAEHAVREELGRLVECGLTGPRFRSGFGPVEPQNRELHRLWNEGRMEPGRGQRAINRLQGGRSAEEIEQTEHRCRVTGQVEGRSWLSANEVYVRIAYMCSSVAFRLKAMRRTMWQCCSAS